MHNMSICCTFSPARRGRCCPSGMSYGFSKEASTCRIEAAGDVGIQNPLCGLADALPDCVDGVPAPSAWSKAVAVWLEYRLPFRLNDHFHQCLFGSVHHRGNAYSTLHLYPNLFWNL